MIARILAMLMLFAVLALGCSTPGRAQEAPAPTAESVIAHLKAAGLPIAEEVIYTAETDTNQLLGRPGQYIAKAAWRDTRVTGVWATDEVSTMSGGGVEVFANEAERITRQDYLIEVSRMPLLGGQYNYGKGTVLVRVARALTPDQAADYERALAALP